MPDPITDLLRSPRTVSFAVLLAAIATNLTGETLMKHGMNQTGELTFDARALLRAFTNPWVVSGLGLAFGAAVLWLRVVSREPLSWAFPMLALSYIPLLFISRFVLGETVSPQRWLGAVVIIAGVFLVYRS
ncbi:hypothetical protein DCC79_14745 [bacterium]|nr:MAG: hypothetical protein DCC79_14745 [bacterium]